MNPLIVVGINTEVGKTVVSAILAEALGAYYWKPVQCGYPKDSDWVKERLSLQKRVHKECFCLKTPCSPHLAAQKEGVRIEASQLVMPRSNPLVIEGTGGIYAPLNEKEVWMDAALQWEGCFVLVHLSYLGSLNHFFLTIEALQKRKAPLLGIVFNHEIDAITEEMLLRKANAPALFKLPWQKDLTPSVIRRIARECRPILHAALGR